MAAPPDLERIRDLIRDVPDYPRPGVVFKDITPLLGDAAALAECVDALAEPYRDQGIDRVVGIEARGFILAAPVAVALGVGFVPARKAGKLPFDVVAESYDLEYGADRLELHTDALGEGQRVLLVDDVLATGGTAAAAARLVGRTGAQVVGFACLMELAFLDGRARLGDLATTALLRYPAEG